MATCRGIDVSAYQGAQDWGARKAEGIVFAFAKASEGQTSRDSRFAAHMRGILAAGLVPGAYHFAWPTQDAEREAANYIAAVKDFARPGFCHWLDLERYSDGRNYQGKSSAQIAVWVTTWLARVRTAFPGQRVGVYTSADDLSKGHVPLGVPVWYPAYPWGPAAYSRAEAAAQPKPSGRAPLIWQFTSQPVDRSIAYMSAADLRAWAQGTETEEDDVALSADDIKKLAAEVEKQLTTGPELLAYLVGTDNVLKAGADEKDPKNAYWAVGSYVTGTYARLVQTQAKVDALAAKVDSLSVGGVDLDALAVKVADLLAARLAQ